MFFERRAQDWAMEWSGSGRTAGLLRGQANLPGPGPHRLRVEARDGLLWEGEVAADEDGLLRVNIHTHLLEDGPHDVRLTATAADGGRAVAQAHYEIDNRGRLAQDVRAALLRHRAPVVFLGDCDARHYAQAQAEATCWIDAPDAPERVEAKLASGEIDDAEAAMLLRFIRDGFVVLDAKLPEPMLQAADAALDEAIASGYQGYEYGSSQRLEQMHAAFPAIRDIWLHAPIHRFLSLVFDAPSQPCQSLVYVFGSQQDAHQDTIHLTPFPAGAMCGVWIALEDVREGSGELAVYPGSHRLPRVYMKDAGAAKVRGGDWSEFGQKVVGRWAQLIAQSGLQPQPYLARRGDILIWHENLMHAGSVRRDMSLSRRSVVTHNFARGAIVYYDSSGNVGYVHDHATG